MSGAERREKYRDWKDRVLERYMEHDQVGAYNLHEDDNAFYVKDQVVVHRRAVGSVEGRLSRFGARRVSPTIELTKSFRAWSLPDFDDDGNDAVFVFDPSRGVNVVEFAYDPPGRSVPGVELNHIVTGFQRRTGWPDGDPEPAPRSLPRMPLPRPTAGAGVRVAIVDTGYPARNRYRNESGWFAPGDSDEVHGWDQVDEDRDGYLDIEAGHGLFVGGVIRRIAPSAKLVHLKALNSDGVGTELGVADAIRQAVGRGVQIVNLSLGFYSLKDVTPEGVAATTAAAREAGIAVVAAAGNDGLSDPAFPAALPDVIGVGSVSADRDGLADFSNRGDWVDVAAPGERVQSTYVGGREDPRLTLDSGSDVFRDTAIWSGTSFACAAVTGHLAAALSQADGGASPVERARAIIAELPVLDGVTRRLDPVYAF